MDRMKVKSCFRRLILLSLILTLSYAGSISAAEDDSKTESDVICNGVFVGEVDISGLTKEEASAKVDAYVAQFAAKEVVLKIDNATVNTTVGALGYQWTNKEVIEEAAKLGKDGNVIKRYKDMKDIENEPKHYDLTLNVDDTMIEEVINTQCTPYNIPHVDATMKREGEGFVFSNESTGRVISVADSVQKIHNHILGDWDGNDTQINLVVVDDLPTVTIADCQKVNAVIGTYSTAFSTNEANSNRNANIANGMRLINGTVVNPGEVFSANDELNPFTEDNGYYPAGTYVNGKVEDSLGGGICQVSSTLYNAVLLAELDVVERSNHSMAVGYVPLAADAALAGSWKDLKFQNSTDAPVYIEAVYEDGKITFTIYGHETRSAGRTVKYVSEQISRVDPPAAVVTYDSSKPAGYRKTTSAAHIGYVAKLWKHVYQDGQEVSVELVNTSTYSAAPAYITVGSGEVEQQEETSTDQPQAETQTVD